MNTCLLRQNFRGFSPYLDTCHMATDTKPAAPTVISNSSTMGLLMSPLEKSAGGINIRNIIPKTRNMYEKLERCDMPDIIWLKQQAE